MLLGFVPFSEDKIFFDYFDLVQPGPDSIGIVAISHGCTGVAARACGLVGLEPTRVSFWILSVIFFFFSNPNQCYGNGWLGYSIGLIFLSLSQVAEILKDRPSWFRDCRTVDVINALPTGNSGTIELLYMQVNICLGFLSEVA